MTAVLALCYAVGLVAACRAVRRAYVPRPRERTPEEWAAIRRAVERMVVAQERSRMIRVYARTDEAAWAALTRLEVRS